MQKRYLVITIIVLFGVIFWLLVKQANVPKQVTTGTSTALAPEPLPAQKDDLIMVNVPLPNAQVSSPLVIRGKARGNWYFEASFPVSLVATDGTVLAQGHADAQGDWMTTDYVPFTATLTYTVPATITDHHAYLILKKDNPSGEPQFENSLSLPVMI